MKQPLVLLCVGIVSAVVWLACSTTTQSPDDTASEAEALGLNQTWTKDYAHTTCADWNQAMDSHQQYVAAADMLTAARDKIDGASGVAPDYLIISFQADITVFCAPGPDVGSVINSVTLTDAAYGIYNDPASHYQPGS